MGKKLEQPQHLAVGDVSDVVECLVHGGARPPQQEPDDVLDLEEVFDLGCCSCTSLASRHCS